MELARDFLYGPGTVTRTAPHLRDGICLWRVMGIVVLALAPCVVMAVYNTGYQANLAIASGAAPLGDWRTALYTLLGAPFDPSNVPLCCLLGGLYFVPVLGVSYASILAVETTTATIRQRPMSESFLVIGLLFALSLPPTIPLWQVALGAAFGVLFGKEVFGGTGMNFLNPALVGRVFLFLAYPAGTSGDAPWTAANFLGVDAFSGATLLAQASRDATALPQASWWQAFYGFVPGSMGETSAVAILLGAAILILTRIASWRTMAGVTLGTWLAATFFNWAGSSTNPMFSVPFHWHVVAGSWAFGTVFFATDPVSSSFTDPGRWVYGLGIGILVILIRVLNPAYTEGTMLAILFMNMFAPLIDHFVVRANIRRRRARNAL